MRFIFQQSRIWEGDGTRVDPDGEVKSKKGKSEPKARRQLPPAGTGRTWILMLAQEEPGS